MNDLSMYREASGSLFAYAWPGGYPMIYLTKDGSVLCPECASGKNGSDASESNDDPQWQLVAGDIFYEGAPIQCDHCCVLIESAYGDPDSE